MKACFQSSGLFTFLGCQTPAYGIDEVNSNMIPKGFVIDEVNSNGIPKGIDEINSNG